MAVTYTNRKDTTYFLCRGVTKTGKTRYFFAREPQNESVEKVPEEYEISESVNGVISLVKAERICYLGSIDDWTVLAFDKSIEELARSLIPALGSDEFFELS